MKRNFTASVSQEGRWFIAQCIEVDVASQGESEEAALNNLRDALELHFTAPVATVAPHVRTVEVEVAA
ncbi:MAG: type II toxin-antitoxin system HicB family antitoxin [Pyrinomonadaceae bacterium]